MMEKLLDALGVMLVGLSAHKNVIKNKEYTEKVLLEEYKLTVQRFQIIWGSWTQTLTLFISGIALLLWYATANPNSARPFYVLIPLLMLAWATQIVVQGSILFFIGNYTRLLESQIQSRTSLPLPAWESRLMPAIFSCNKFFAIMLFNGVVFSIIYGICAFKAVKFLDETEKWRQFSGISAFVYFGCWVFVLLIWILYEADIRQHVTTLKDELQRWHGDADY